MGDFCHACGEKRVDARDLTVKHFATDAMRELTSLDSKLLRTLAALLFKPGFLTLEWIAGRRNRYLKPLNLCLGVFALSIFVYSVYKPVSMYKLQTIVEVEKTGQFIAAINRRAQRRNTTPEAMLDEMSERWQRYMSLMPVLFVLSFALVLQVVFLLFARRYFVEHLVFSIHFVSFSLLSVIFLWPVYFFIGIKPGGINVAVSLVKWLVDIAYMFFAVRAVYRLGTAKTLFVSLLLVAGYFASYVLVYAGSLMIAIFATVFK
ncbi:MAG: DUF3667 domain-containing protein [Pyrinomonadaceae bacterium]